MDDGTDEEETRAAGMDREAGARLITFSSLLTLFVFTCGFLLRGAPRVLLLRAEDLFC
jgi:hypothetical protein